MTSSGSFELHLIEKVKSELAKSKICHAKSFKINKNNQGLKLFYLYLFFLNQIFNKNKTMKVFI